MSIKENLRAQMHKMVDEFIDNRLYPVPGLNGGVTPEEARVPDPAPQGQGEQEPASVPKPEGKRVVRTKSSGDRVYLLDDVKKTRQWVYSPEVLDSVGFDMGDVTEIEDNELLKYTMGPALLKPVVRPNESA